MDTGTGPIHSSLIDDPAAAEGIESFVLVLAEQVDELQDCEARGQFGALAEQSDALGAAAETVGYPLLQQSCAEVANAARQAHAELARKALIELTEVARRVRQGHRGSI